MAEAYLIVNLKHNVSWLSIAFSDTDLMYAYVLNKLKLILSIAQNSVKWICYIAKNVINFEIFHRLYKLNNYSRHYSHESDEGFLFFLLLPQVYGDDCTWGDKKVGCKVSHCGESSYAEQCCATCYRPIETFTQSEFSFFNPVQCFCSLVASIFDEHARGS